MKLAGKILGVALLAGAALAGAAQPAAAQEDRFDAQNWKPAYDPYGFITVEGAKRMEPLQMHFAATFDWARNPVRLAEDRGGGAYGAKSVIRDWYILDATGAIGLLNFGKTAGLTLGIDVPFAFATNGIDVDPDPNTGEPEGVRATAFGDIRTGLKLTLTDREEDAIGFALKVDLQWPTGRPDMYLSNEYRLVTPCFSAVLDKKWNFFRVGANIGYEYLYEDLHFTDVTISDKIKIGAAVEVTPFDGALKPLSGIIEFIHWFRAASPYKCQAEAPMELGGAIKYGGKFFGEIGANGGLNYGVGSPDVRLYASIGFTF